MPKVQYIEKKFRAESLETIERVNSIIQEYDLAGYSLTLRQVYYQLVARGFIPNNDRSYKNLGNLINDGRMAGLIDWYAITDRTRFVRKNPHWDNISDIVKASANQFYKDHWIDSPDYVEVWVEKDALIDIVQQVCEGLDVPCFSCRGYVSQSEMWQAAMRFKKQEIGGKQTHILHFGDHDPSGIDMSRDIQERLEMFGSRVVVERLALNRDQIDIFNPPPNPAKVTDARFSSYTRVYGYECWELDALDPQTLTKEIKKGISNYLNLDIWDRVEKEIADGKDKLIDIASSI